MTGRCVDPLTGRRLTIELALLVLLAVLWGGSYLLIAVAVETIPPLTLIAARVATAAIILTAVMAVRGERLPRDRGLWGMLLVQAVFNSIAAWTLLAWGQQHVASGLASVLNSTAPIFVFFITLGLTRHERTGAARLAGACLGVAGVVLIVGPGVLAGLGNEVMAQLAILAGAALYGCAAVYGRRFAHLPATVTAAATMLWASLWLIPASLVVEAPWTLRPSPASLIAAATLGVVCTGLALLLYFRLLRTLGSMGVASQAYLRACVGVVLGVAVLGESLTATTALGLAAAIAGVALINRPR